MNELTTVEPGPILDYYPPAEPVFEGEYVNQGEIDTNIARGVNDLHDVSPTVEELLEQGHIIEDASKILRDKLALIDQPTINALGPERYRILEVMGGLTDRSRVAGQALIIPDA